MYKFPSNCQIPVLDKKYEKLFGDIIGTFVEIGGYDGESFSNSVGLADANWTGLYVEPVPQYAQMCSNRHAKNNVMVAQCAIGPEKKLIDIFVGGTLTTTKKDQVDAYDKIDWAKGHHQGKTIQVQQLPLDFVLRKAKINPGFELLIVDVEGSETDVFNSFSLEEWQPKVMIVELEDQHHSFQQFPEVIEKARTLREKIISFNYVEFWKDEINTIFLEKTPPSE